MELINQVHLTEERLTQFLKETPKNTPITMVNIIRFKEMVPGEEISGEEVYNRYGMLVIPFLKAVGGKIVWRGKVQQTLIGDERHSPHAVLLVTYPSSDHFLRMITNEGYKKITKDRTISLEYGGLLATTAEYSSF